MSKQLVRLTFSLSLVLGGTVGFTQKIVIPAQKTSVPPIIDGSVDPEEWQGIPTLKSNLVNWERGTPSDEIGQIWIAYDDTYIYVASRIALQNPDLIQANETRDGMSLSGDDSFGISINVFGTGQSFSGFTFNPNGANRLKIASGRAGKREWTGRFDSAAKITETGWEGEMKIPWGIMDLPPSGKRDLIVGGSWHVSSRSENLSWKHSESLDKQTVWAGVEVPDIKQKEPFLFLPYVSAGIGEKDEFLEIGLDVKKKLSGQTTFVSSVNPDFRNVEGDILNLDFSNFERLPGETRPFFLEGAQHLGINSGFASQRIQDFDIGVKAYGSLADRLQFGTLSTVDDGDSVAFAGSATYNLDLLTAFSGSVVNQSKDGEANFVSNLGFSTSLGTNYFSGSFGISQDEILGQGEQFSFNATHSTRSFAASLGAWAVSPTYLPRLGYAPQPDARSLSLIAVHNQGFVDGPIREWQIRMGATDTDRYSGGHFEESLSLSTNFYFRSGYRVLTSSRISHFLDRHDNVNWLLIQWPTNDRRRLASVSYSWGKVIENDYKNLSLSLNVQPLAKLRGRISYQFVELVNYQDQAVLNLNWEIDDYQLIAGRAVKRGDRWNWYLSYRMSGNEGNEYYLIVGNPNAQSFEKTIALKVLIPLSAGG